MEEQNQPSKKDTWSGKGYSFFTHTRCEYFPCHMTDDPGSFNCLFCYCPLYCLGPNCGGNFKYTKSGVKSCTDCDIPHRRENYGRIVAKLAEIKGGGSKSEGEAAWLPLRVKTKSSP